MSTNNMKRRKNYFVKKRFQANFFIKFGLLLVLEALLIGALFMLVSKDTLTTYYSGMELKLQKTSTFFFTNFLLISLIAGVAIGIAGIFVFMYLSHRIAGPLYRFEETVEELRRGDLTQRVGLRKTDQLQELNRPMNAFIEEMDNRLSGIKDEVGQALGVVRKGKGGSESSAISKILEKIKTSLEYFKTSR